MMAGMYAAISGLDANQAMLNDTANDLANVNTVGYKSSSITFADSLTQVCAEPPARPATNGGSNPVQVGLGVQVSATRNEMTEGSFQTTNNPLDVAIEGAGFLRVGAGDPPAKDHRTRPVCRKSELHARRRPDHQHEGFLTTAGRRIRDRPQRGGHRNGSRHHLRAGQRRHLHEDPARLQNVSIGQDGSVAYTDNNPESKTYQQRVTAGYLSLATFANEAGLERLGGSLWGQTANSGAPIVGTPDTAGFGSTIGGVLEMSNVDLATEMTNMITAERGYQANSRVITTADEMLGSLVTMVQ